MTDLDTWRALGPALERLVAAGQRAVTEAYHEHVRAVLIAGGLDEDDPLWRRVRALAPRFDDGELAMQASIGAFGPRIRELHGECYAANELHGMWRTTDEALELIGDPWDSLRNDLDGNGPPWPEDALAALEALAAELEKTGRGPFGTWPLVATGERRSDIVGQTLAQVSERTGIARDQLPAVPADLDDEPVLVLSDAAQAIEAVHEWMLDRQGRARTLGRLAALLPPSSVD